MKYGMNNEIVYGMEDEVRDVEAMEVRDGVRDGMRTGWGTDGRWDRRWDGRRGRK